MDVTTHNPEPGQRVRVTDEMPRLTGAITATVEGTLVRRSREKTGSWHAHGRDTKLWLDRLVIRKDDGELVVCNIRPATRVEIIAQPGVGERAT